MAKLQNKRLLLWKLIAICCCLIFFFLCFVSNFSYISHLKTTVIYSSLRLEDVISCYSKENANRLVSILKSPPLNKKRIFFLESSCNSFEGDIVLTPRQACAVESAAKMNPNTEVTILFTSPIKIADPIFSRSTTVHALLSYPNVYLKHVYVEDFINGTVLENLYKNGALKYSSYPVSHASDLLRYLTLWKYGGTYLDLDVVVMKSLEEISNFAGAESLSAVAAGAVNLEDALGHEIATDCINELKNNFQSENWGSNGPGVITRVLQNRCHTKETYKMLEEQCDGFKVLLPSAFYPIPWRHWEKYFLESNKNATLKAIENSYAIHVWNKLSSSSTIRVGSDQPYGVIASMYCPEVYSNCGSEF